MEIPNSPKFDDKTWCAVTNIFSMQLCRNMVHIQLVEVQNSILTINQRFPYVEVFYYCHFTAAIEVSPVDYECDSVFFYVAEMSQSKSFLLTHRGYP